MEQNIERTASPCTHKITRKRHKEFDYANNNRQFSVKTQYFDIKLKEKQDNNKSNKIREQGKDSSTVRVQEKLKWRHNHIELIQK